LSTAHIASHSPCTNGKSREDQAESSE